MRMAPAGLTAGPSAGDEETGWAYAKLSSSITDVLLEAPIAPLHRVFADPDDVADVADGLVHHWHTPHGETAQSGIGTRDADRVRCLPPLPRADRPELLLVDPGP
ncbi:hypothetical protein [Streptomyces coeruleorubidus]|nr:hypothetical protein [Streptomyces coeruleorubidus]GGU03171.1 hypothetical protein GCM10010256_74080 [Streptomyces coeruleorubidus]